MGCSQVIESQMEKRMENYVESGSILLYVGFERV